MPVYHGTVAVRQLAASWQARRDDGAAAAGVQWSGCSGRWTSDTLGRYRWPEGTWPHPCQILVRLSSLKFNIGYRIGSRSGHSVSEFVFG